MKSIIKKIFLGVLIITHAIGAVAQTQNSAVLEKVDSIFTSHYDDEIAGGAFAIIKNGKVVYKKTAGLANIEHRIPVRENTVFNIASNSKQFTSLLALILEEEGKLSFQDDIRIYLPELSKLPHKITIQQLTNHTHGLPNVDELAQLKGMDDMTFDEILIMLLNIKQLNFTPGDDYQYNNTGYVLLSQIIERIGEKAFDEQLKLKVFDKLGMFESQVVADYRIIPKKAYSYSPTNNVYVNNPAKLGTKGSSGIYTSLNDLIKWSQNFINTDSPFRKHLRRMQEPTALNSGKVIEYGMGLQSENYKGVDILFHGGGTESYRSYVLHVPKHRLSLVFLANNGGFSGYEIVYNVLETLLIDFIVESRESGTSKDLAAYVGTYELHPGNYYDIIDKNDSLYLQVFGTEYKAYLPRIDKKSFKGPWAFSKIIFKDYGFDLRWADFTYPAKRIDVTSSKDHDIDMNQFTGTYKNKEHDVFYEIEVIDNNLAAKHPIHGTTTLDTFSQTSFYGKNSSFGKIDFFFDSAGKVQGFKLSGQNINNLLFLKN